MQHSSLSLPLKLGFSTSLKKVRNSETCLAVILCTTYTCSFSNSKWATVAIDNACPNSWKNPVLHLEHKSSFPERFLSLSQWPPTQQPCSSAPPALPCHPLPLPSLWQGVSFHPCTLLSGTGPLSQGCCHSEFIFIHMRSSTWMFFHNIWMSLRNL